MVLPVREARLSVKLPSADAAQVTPSYPMSAMSYAMSGTDTAASYRTSSTDTASPRPVLTWLMLLLFRTTLSYCHCKLSSSHLELSYRRYQLSNRLVFLLPLLLSGSDIGWCSYLGG